jgi:regulator of sigma E protease
MLVVLAGAFMNFVLAFIIIFALKSINGYKPPVVDSLIDGYPAAQAGLQSGDAIKAVNGKKIRIYEDLIVIMDQNKGNTAVVTVERGNKALNYEITPKLSEDGSQWLIGFAPKGLVKGNILENMSQSFWNLIFYIKYTYIGLAQMVTGQIAAKEMTGPIGIVNMMGQSYQEGLQYSVWVAIESVAKLAAFISANLGVVNLLPLPALDGGRFVFLAIEAIRRKPVSAEKEGMVHFIGFVALMILAVFVAFNDVLNLI